MKHQQISANAGSNDGVGEGYTKKLAQYDKAHKGNFETSEVGAILRLLSFDPTLKDIEEISARVDPLSTGSFVKFQLLEALENYQVHRYTEKDVLEAVQSLDADPNSSIKVSTLQEALMEHGEKFTLAEFEEVVKALDPEKTGLVKLRDLLEALMRKDS